MATQIRTHPQIRALFTTITGPTRLKLLKIGEGDEERSPFGWKLGPAPALRYVRKKLTDVRKRNNKELSPKQI